MQAQQLNLDNVANNLANASTAGFRKRRLQFEDLMYQNMIQPGSASGSQTIVPAGLQIGLGVRPVSNEIIQLQGNMAQTGNALDIAIEGKGFFQITQADGTLAYTRDGSFQLNKDGNLVNSAGLLVSPQINLPAQALNVTIASDGTVTYSLPGQNASQTAGQIQIANFQNPAGLNSMGNNLYTPTDASGQAIIAPAIMEL